VTTAGIANVDILNSGLSLWAEDRASSPDTSYEPRLVGTSRGALRELLAHFVRCVTSGRPSEILGATDGSEAVRICTALVRSAAENRELEL
jgi:predicted dehydrogenase